MVKQWQWWGLYGLAVSWSLLPTPAEARQRRRLPRPPAAAAQPAGEIIAEYEEFTFDPATSTITLLGNPSLTRGTDRLTADRLEYQRDTGQATATGNVVLRTMGQEIRASSATFNLNTREGRAVGITTIVEGVQITAEELLLTGERWTAR